MRKAKSTPPPIKTEDDIKKAEAQIVELSKRIEFYITEYSVELLAKKKQEGDFVIPTYQREDTWEENRKSKFIESLIIGLPIPFVFFWEMPDGKLEIVDGSQRLRTIEKFLKGELRLENLESLTALNGFNFFDLPESRQRKIKNRSIRGIILNEHADEQARFDMFERINTGSKIANKAEVRRGALIGPFMKLISTLAKEKLFTDLAPVSKKLLNEREHEELVTRLFAYGDGLNGYKDRPAEFIFKYVKNMNKVLEHNPALETEYCKVFYETMDFISRVFPYGFRKSAKGEATPRARFEAIAIGSYLAIKENPEILTTNLDLNVEAWLIKNHDNQGEFDNVVGSDGANSIARLRGRIEFVRDRLLEAASA